MSGQRKPEIILKSIVITIILIVCMSVPQQGYGWGGENHKIITRAALAFLPQWERDVLGVWADSLIQQYCLIPDHYRTEDYEQTYAPYIEIPYLPATGLYHKSPDPLADIYIFTYFSEKAVEHLRRKNIGEAARYIGTLTHFIEDNSCPVHVVDNRLLEKLLPTPPHIIDFQVHRSSERPEMTLTMSGYQPRILGATVFEAVEPFIERFLEMQDNSRAQAIPIIEGIYEGNEEKSFAGRTRAAEPALRLLADVWHTLFTIAYEK